VSFHEDEQWRLDDDESRIPSDTWSDQHSWNRRKEFFIERSCGSRLSSALWWTGTYSTLSPSIRDPPGRHGAQLHEFLHSTRKKILDQLFVQVLRMKRYLEEQGRLNLIPELWGIIRGFIPPLRWWDPSLIGLQRSQEILLMILNKIILIHLIRSPGIMIMI